MKRMLTVLVGAAALLVSTGGAANAALSGGGCVSVTVDRVFGEVCTFTSVANPFVGWYPGEDSPTPPVQIGLRVTGPGVDRTTKLPPKTTNPVVNDWTNEPYRAGFCYTALVEISGQTVEAPAICA